MKLILHAEQLRTLALEHPLDRYARPFRHDLRNVLGSDRLGDDRVLDRRLTRSELVYRLLGLGHLSVAYLRNLAVVACPFGIMCLYLVILHLLTLGLEVGEYAPFFVPLLTEQVTSGTQIGKFRLDLINLEGCTFTLYSLSLDLKLTYATVEFGYRLGHGIHLQTQL